MFKVNNKNTRIDMAQVLLFLLTLNILYLFLVFLLLTLNKKMLVENWVDWLYY